MSYYTRRKSLQLPLSLLDAVRTQQPAKEPTPESSGNAAWDYESWQHTDRLYRPAAQAEEGEALVDSKSYGSG